MKSKLVLTMVALTMAIALVAGGTMAWFTSTDDAGEAVFTAGTLAVDASDGLTEFADIAPFTAQGKMNPGDIYEEIEIIISNTGNKNLAWFGNWTFNVKEQLVDGVLVPMGDDRLLDAIYIDSMKMEFLGDDWNNVNGAYGPGQYNADQFITNGIGSGTYPGWYNTLANMTQPWVDRKVVTLRNWNNNNGMGVGPLGYEHMGALKGLADTSYKLTVRFGFHEEAGNYYQGDVAAPIVVGFTVDATQVNADAITAEIGAAAAQMTFLDNTISDQ